LSVDYSDVDIGVAGVDGKVWELNSNASRVGIKGNEKLTDELTSVYKAEWGVQGDVKAGDLNPRERYIGLKHYQWGTVRLGHIDSPFKNAEDSVDAFNDATDLDMDNFLTGQTRLENSINYVSPKFLDVFGANITLQPGETVTGANENHIADGISAAFSYEDDSLYLSFAMDKEIATKLPDTAVVFLLGKASGTSTILDRDAMRFNARYKLNELTLSAMFQQSEASNDKVTGKLDEQAVVLSAFYNIDKITVRGEVLMNNLDAGSTVGEVDTTVIGVGVDYNLTQSTKVFGNLAMNKDEPSKVTGFKDVDSTYLGFGMETRF
jgi:predicted porin